VPALPTGLLMAGHSCVAPVLPVFAGEFGATAAQVGMTLSAFAAARLVLNVPCGMLADKYGRRPLILAGPVITAVGMLGSAMAPGLPELFAWRFVAGAGSAVYMSGAQALLADISKASNRARVLGTNQAAVLAGAAIGPAVGGIMAGWLDLGCRSPFVAVGAMCGLAAVHAYYSVPETAAAVLRRRRRTAAQQRVLAAREAQRKRDAAMVTELNVKGASDEIVLGANSKSWVGVGRCTLRILLPPPPPRLIG
jgi:DHA1 family multidrug resistance protein-like MFS transporter